MKIYKIGVSCIGSGVGQSVITSCNRSRIPIQTIGFGANVFAYGQYECDYYDATPSIYAENYIEILIEKCKKWKIDLLIPGHDDEAFLLSKNLGLFEKAGVEVIVSSPEVLELCRDKEKMSNVLNKHVDIFVKSFDVSQVDAAISTNELDFPFIAKPRDGYASRGIEIINNSNELSRIKDFHIIQQLAIPHRGDFHHESYVRQIAKNVNPQVSEISIQLVANKDGDIIGRMMSYNKLNNGVPIEIIPFTDPVMWTEIEQLFPVLKELGLRGPINLQGRLTDSGLRLFEMNARFTGITGLRSMMGFNEVEWCIKHWLNIGKDGELIINQNLIGIRQTADKVVARGRSQRMDSAASKICGAGTVQQETIKKILITGATGYLGLHLTERLIAEERYDISVFTRDKTNQSSVFSPQISVFDQDDLDNGNLALGNIDLIIHCGFARPHRSQTEILASLAFTVQLFNRAVQHQVANIINISSQSIYEGDMPGLRSESFSINPKSGYAQAKYTSEIVLSEFARSYPQLRYTSLRVGTIVGGHSGMKSIDLVSKLAQKALGGEPIEINVENQLVSRLDVLDFADAIDAMLKVNPLDWKGLYNLGSNEIISLEALAEIIVEEAEKKGVANSHAKIVMNYKHDLRSINVSLDSSLFYNDFGWQPKRSLRDSVRSILDYFSSVNEAS